MRPQEALQSVRSHCAKRVQRRAADDPRSHRVESRHTIRLRTGTAAARTRLGVPTRLRKIALLLERSFVADRLRYDSSRGRASITPALELAIAAAPSPSTSCRSRRG